MFCFSFLSCLHPCIMIGYYPSYVMINLTCCVFSLEYVGYLNPLCVFFPHAVLSHCFTACPLQSHVFAGSWFDLVFGLFICVFGLPVFSLFVPHLTIDCSVDYDLDHDLDLSAFPSYNKAFIIKSHTPATTSPELNQNLFCSPRNQP